MQSVVKFASLVSEMVRRISCGSLAGGTNTDCESQRSLTPTTLPHWLASCFPRGKAGDGEGKSQQWRGTSASVCVWGGCSLLAEPCKSCSHSRADPWGLPHPTPEVSGVHGFHGPWASKFSRLHQQVSRHHAGRERGSQ